MKIYYNNEFEAYSMLNWKTAIISIIIIIALMFLDVLITS